MKHTKNAGWLVTGDKVELEYLDSCIATVEIASPIIMGGLQMCILKTATHRYVCAYWTGHDVDEINSAMLGYSYSKAVAKYRYYTALDVRFQETESVSTIG